MGKGETDMRSWGFVVSVFGLFLAGWIILISAIAIANEKGTTNFEVRNNTITLSSIGIVAGVAMIILGGIAIKKITVAHKLYIDAQSHQSKPYSQYPLSDQQPYQQSNQISYKPQIPVQTQIPTQLPLQTQIPVQTEKQYQLQPQLQTEVVQSNTQLNSQLNSKPQSFSYANGNQSNMNQSQNPNNINQNSMRSKNSNENEDVFGIL